MSDSLKFRVLVGIMLLQLAMPMVSVAAVDGRAAADFSVDSVTLSSGYSVTDASGVHNVGIGDHILRIVISNQGSAAGVPTITVVHTGSTNVQTQIGSQLVLDELAAVTTAAAVPVDWNGATAGAGQSITVTVTSSGDSNPANDEQILTFDVKNLELGNALGDSIPEADPSHDNKIVILPQSYNWNATVINEGTTSLSAKLKITFTDINDGTNIISEESGEINLLPGNLFIPAVARNLSLVFDASNNANLLTNSWNMVGEVIFQGPGGPQTVTTSAGVVTFSDHVATLVAPSPRVAEEGDTIIVTWMLNNYGTDDIFDVSLTDTEASDWFQGGIHGTPILILDNASKTISVTVDIPDPCNMPCSPLNTLTLVLTSRNATIPYTLTADALVHIGDSYSVSITAPAGQEVIPGQPLSLSYTLTNTGTTPAAFDVTTGLTKTSLNWVVEISASKTDVIAPATTTTIVVSITPAPLSNPLLSAERNTASDTVNVWLQAVPAEGGTPVLDNTVVLTVKTIISFDPGPVQTDIVLDATSILSENASNGNDTILKLNVGVLHNLGSSVSGTMDVSLTVSNHNFSASSSGGSGEAVRWSTAFDQSSIPDIAIGSSVSRYLLLDMPADELPMAGVHTFAITAAPGATSSANFGGAEFVSVTENVTLTIPSIQNGEIIADDLLPASIGNSTEFSLLFANTGNDVDSYRFSIEGAIPNGWNASIDTGLVTNPQVVSNLTPSMADHPITGSAHTTNVTLNITTDPQSPANTTQSILIKVEDFLTGELIEMKTLNIFVGELIQAQVSPTNQTVQLAPGSSAQTTIFVNNTGNVATTYTLTIDDSEARDVNFEIVGNSQILVAPGYSSQVQIRMSTDGSASADDIHLATLHVDAVGMETLLADISADIDESYDFTISAPVSVEVIPGVNESINISITNLGNLEVTAAMSATIVGNWSSSWAWNTITIPIQGTIDNTINIEVPDLDTGEPLSDGAVHKLTIFLYNSNNSMYLTEQAINLVVAPLFTVNVTNWDDEKFFHRDWQQPFTPTLINTGNRDVIADITWEIIDSGGITQSTDWDFVQSSPLSSIVLSQGVPVSLPFGVISVASFPVLATNGELRITLTPRDAEVTGSAVLTSSLQMSRLFNYESYLLSPNIDNKELTIEIPWSRIPEVSPSNGAYEIAFCGAERLIDVSSQGLNPQDYAWGFSFEGGGNTSKDLPVAPNCDSGNISLSKITLTEVIAYATNHVKFGLDIPDFPNIYPGDGWNLTFRLYHPDEHNAYTVYTEATFMISLDNYADPGLSDLSFSKSDITEGDEFQVTTTLSNYGTAVALKVSVTLSCDGLLVEAPVYNQVILFPGQQTELAWDVKASNLDWWVQEQQIQCHAVLNSGMMVGNIDTNDKASTAVDFVDSWSPGVTVSFLAVIISIVGSLIFIRLIGQDEKYRLAAVYSGVIAFGFAFHLIDFIWWGPLITLGAAGWVWIMTWRSTKEFQLVHEDYQRARRGDSTLYSDHKDVIRDTQKQLGIILALPILGFVAVVLGIPPAMSPDSNNFITMIGYVLLVMIGVWIVVWRANRMYANLYGRLTELEVKTGSLEKDLGDPARLLTELATDGLDLSGILVLPTAVGSGGPNEDIYSDSLDNEMLDTLGDLTGDLPYTEEKGLIDLDDAVLLGSDLGVDEDV